MSSLANIVESACWLAAGATLCFLLVWWKDRNLKRARALEADVLLGKARTDAELIIRDARLAANDEAAKQREQLEQSFAARRAERSEQERRLSERETLINTQLERLVDTEKTLKQQETSLRESS